MSLSAQLPTCHLRSFLPANFVSVFLRLPGEIGKNLIQGSVLVVWFGLSVFHDNPPSSSCVPDCLVKKSVFWKSVCPHYMIHLVSNILKISVLGPLHINARASFCVGFFDWPNFASCFYPAECASTFGMCWSVNFSTRSAELTQAVSGWPSLKVLPKFV